MTEQEQISAALKGDKTALETLITDVQSDLYNLAVRMLWHPQDAEDATQEIIIKLITKLSTFAGKSSFKTWAWRIAINHLLNIRKRRAEQDNLSFEDMAQDLDTFLADDKLPVEDEVQQKLLIEEAKIGCMQAMLLCLKRDERAAYILGDILGITDKEGAIVFEISASAYRKRLSRARQRIRDFMQNKCGIYDPENPCRCSRRVKTAIVHQRINPDKFLFAQDGENQKVLDGIQMINEVERVGALYKTHPQYQSPEFLQKVLDFTDLN
jgi:RNA polymerase sigma factor (sigma-70 family)